MELYIEKDFIDNFFIDYDEFHIIHKIVGSIFKEYHNLTVLMNVTIENVEDLVNLKKENGFIAYLCNNNQPPIPVDSIKDDLFSKSKFEQTIVFMDEKKDWFLEAENKGVLCFSFDNFKEKINEIINNLHFNIDLSEKFYGWEVLKNFKSIRFNSISISDNYILSDKTQQKMDENVFPLLKNVFFDKENKIKISFFTKELNPISKNDKHIKEKAKKRYNKLNSAFANFDTTFSIILTDLSSGFDFHDRIIMTNFSILESGKGFNLIPFKKSNSQIISRTIFDKYTYKRLNNLQLKYSEYLNKLNNLETLKFKMYP